MYDFPKKYVPATSEYLRDMATSVEFTRDIEALAANGGGVIEPPEAVKKLSMGDILRFWDFVAALMPTDWTLRSLRDGGIARELCGPDVPLTF